MSLIDTHAHLYYESMESVLSEVLERAGSKGVNKIVCIGTDIDTSLKSVKIAEKYDNVFATVGMQRHGSPSESRSSDAKPKTCETLITAGGIRT